MQIVTGPAPGNEGRTFSALVRKTVLRLGLVAVAFVGISFASVQPVAALGDLIVAPTRLVFDDRKRGAEVVLNNAGRARATYRVSLELRRMTPDGQLEEVTQPNEVEKQALGLISYAPRRVTLEPQQTQAVRVAVRKPAGLPHGEYRVHMLFRAIPDEIPAAATLPPADPKALTIQLTPVYGVSIPVIVRHGSTFEAGASISDVQVVETKGREAVALTLTRTGTRSIYGEVRVLKSGQATPIARVRGIGLYPEITHRTVVLPIANAGKHESAGPATVQYVELDEQGEKLLAEASVTLPGTGR